MIRKVLVLVFIVGFAVEAIRPKESGELKSVEREFKKLNKKHLRNQKYAKNISALKDKEQKIALSKREKIKLKRLENQAHRYLNENDFVMANAEKMRNKLEAMTG